MPPNLVELNKIKVGAVNYLNTKPLIYGLQHSIISNEIDLIEDYPAKIADFILNNQIDIGLVPVAILPELKEYFLISDYCIGAITKVESVLLVSEKPIDFIETIYLDYQSRTSIILIKILMKYYWKKEVKFIQGNNNYIENICEINAGVIIGDRALELRYNYAYVYDLATAWNSLTNLPFVFAAWVSNKPISEKFIEDFNKANKFGIENYKTILSKYQNEKFDVEKYFTENISYQFDEKKREGLNMFLKLMKEFV